VKRVLSPDPDKLDFRFNCAAFSIVWLFVPLLSPHTKSAEAVVLVTTPTTKLRPAATKSRKARRRAVRGRPSCVADDVIRERVCETVSGGGDRERVERAKNGGGQA